MAKITKFRKNSAAIREGEWIKPGEEYDDLEILTRGFTDEYLDAQAQKLRRAAASWHGQDRIPVKIKRDINTELLLRYVILDVRNLQHGDGTAVTLEQFKQMLLDPDYDELLLACYRAASQVGQVRQGDLEEAVGN
ncbi:hypothetical protein [Teichococcus aestuarii]|jgi:hypothetical protein|uniref:hypothetical protein n=1 Tax=Teichococcus aestuarii TaxID=568898 RepID=UPI003618DACF